MYMPLSDASIGNLERLSRFIDAGFLKDQSHKESIKKHAMANKVVDEQFWSHIERLAGLLSSGILTTEDHQQQIQEKVEALLRTGESRSIAASGRAAEGGGSSVPEKVRVATSTRYDTRVVSIKHPPDSTPHVFQCRFRANFGGCSVVPYLVLRNMCHTDVVTQVR
jgi:hypothetical protein